MDPLYIVKEKRGNKKAKIKIKEYFDRNVIMLLRRIGYSPKWPKLRGVPYLIQLESPKQQQRKVL